MPLLTHGRFHEQPQRRRRSRPHDSECSFSVGGTSQSLERNLSNRKDHTALIIKYQDKGCDILMQFWWAKWKIISWCDITEFSYIYDVTADIVKISIIYWCAAGCQTLEFRLYLLKTNRLWRLLIMLFHWQSRILYICAYVCIPFDEI